MTAPLRCDVAAKSGVVPPHSICYVLIKLPNC